MDECQCTRNVEIAVKKRKLGLEDSEPSSSNYVAEIECDSSEKFGFLENIEESDGVLKSSDQISASDCSSNDSGGEICVRSVHLKVKRLETEISSTSDNNKISDRTPQQSEISSNSSSMESSPSKTKSHRKKTLTNVKMPSAAELDAFFSAAEKYERKIFAEKYNYDVVNDVPMEGRYEWIQLKPGRGEKLRYN